MLSPLFSTPCAQRKNITRHEQAMRRQRGPHGRFLSKEEKDAQLVDGSFCSSANPNLGNQTGASAGGAMTAEQRQQATQAACSSTWAVLSRIRVRAPN